MTDVSSHITTDPVGQTTCDQCGAELDVSGIPSFTTVECPKCKADVTVPARLGTFRLLSLLGQGGMGAVYRGIDTSLDRPVAVKVLLRSVGDDPEFVETFQKEAKAAAALSHPNIVQIYQFGREKGQPYIAMELLLGGRLDKMIATGNLLEAALVIKIAIDVAQGLKAAGDIGLVHGDVKPENILLDSNGTAKIVDFGLAAYMDRGSRREGVWGTPYYIAPEKVRGKPGDLRSDIYSLGATLFHALTLKPPFEGETAVDVVKARIRKPAPAVNELRKDVHAEVVRVIQRMLEAEPSRRYPTYTSLIADLRSVAEKIGPPRNLTRIKRGSGKIVLPKRGKSLPASTRITATGNVAQISGHINSLTATGSLKSGKPEKKPISGRRIAAMLIVLLCAAGAAGGWWHWQEVQTRQEQVARQQHLAHVADTAREIFVALDEKVHLTHQRLRETYPLLHSATEKMEDAERTLQEAGITNGINQVAEEWASVPENIRTELEEAERAVSRMRDRLTMVSGKRRDLEDQHEIAAADRLLAAIQERAEEVAGDHKAIHERLDGVVELYEKLAVLDAMVTEKKEQLAKAERQRLEEERRQRELEAQRQAEAERERELAQKVAAENEQLDELREELLVMIRRNEFIDALEQARAVRHQWETEEVRKAADIWIERLALLPEIKTVIIDQLAQNGYPWGWLGQRDIVGADSQTIHLHNRKLPWHDVPVRQMLRFIDRYSEADGLDAQKLAQFNLAAAAYFYENNALPLAQTYARKAIRIQVRLREKVERIMPEIEDL